MHKSELLGNWQSMAGLYPGSPAWGTCGLMAPLPAWSDTALPHQEGSAEVG